MKLIQSRDNPQFKELAKIASSARHRAKTNRTLLDGAHLLAAYVDSGEQPQQILLNAAAALNEEVSSLVARVPDVPVTRLGEKLMSELSELRTPTGVLALIDFPRPTITIRDATFVLLLEDIQDPGNLGSILRSAAAAGCDAVFLSENCADAWSPKVLRAAMGGHFALHIFEKQLLSEVIDLFPGVLYATSLQSEVNLYDCNFDGHIGFLVGNEGAGLSSALESLITRKLKIPMHGNIESLNVAAATAICLFEATRQMQQVKPRSPTL
ncbi:MAG: RNA methyltransferase [Gallionella sp.]